MKTTEMWVTKSVSLTLDKPFHAYLMESHNLHTREWSRKFNYTPISVGSWS